MRGCSTVPAMAYIVATARVAPLLLPPGRVGRLHELERHPVALADGEVLRPVLIAELQAGRQRPHACRVVLRILGVRVDLGLAGELEAGRLDALDEPLLGQIA